MSEMLLEVAVLHARDVPGCQEGGADRLALVVPGEVGGTSPDLAAAASVIRASELPVRIMLRLNESFTTTGGEFMRLVGLAEEYVALGAEGVVFGFLDADLEIDVETCAALAGSLPGVPWTLHRAIDHTLDLTRSWRRIVNLTGLTSVLTAGSPQGLQHGLDDLLTLVGSSPDVARLATPSGGLLPEHVPWLARAGVRQFHVGVQVRPGATYKSYVAGEFVRSWRSMLDDAPARTRLA
ncbi:MAG: copper homeostasis protein CutC [Actinomycetota bacterium]|nr:copper homeostasis protein CutC [Actinomycetota bacterium]